MRSDFKQITTDLPWKLSEGGIRTADDSWDSGRRAATVRVINDWTIEGRLYFLRWWCDTACVERTAWRSQRPSWHPTYEEELALRSTDTALIVATANPDWVEHANHITLQVWPHGCWSVWSCSRDASISKKTSGVYRVLVDLILNNRRRRRQNQSMVVIILFGKRLFVYVFK